MDKHNPQKRKLLKIPWYLFITARPRQWLKNLVLFAPLVFVGEFFDPDKFKLVFLGFLLFSLLASSVYILNDIIDAKKDKVHPYKKFRPIAQGLLNPAFAFLAASLGAVISLYLGYKLLPFFFSAMLIYLVMQVVYTFILKQLILLDVMTIAVGYLIRLYAGALLIDAHLTVWFLLAAISLSLFLAIGKRRSELTLLAGNAPSHRGTLLHYPENLLDALVAMFSTAAWVTYAIFTFLEPPPKTSTTVLVLLSGYLPRTLLASKWLMITIPLVIYGVMRYLYVIYEKKQGESPEKVLLTDFPLLATVFMWGFLVLFVIYWLGT